MMKAVKVMATVNEQGSLFLDQPLNLTENSRVEVIVLIPETATPNEEDEPLASREEILHDFAQAWDEAMTGKTIPLSQLWEDIENV